MHEDNVLETEKMVLSRDVGIDWSISRIADENIVRYYVERAHREGELAYEQYEDIPIFNWDNDGCTTTTNSISRYLAIRRRRRPKRATFAVCHFAMKLERGLFMGVVIA